MHYRQNTNGNDARELLVNATNLMAALRAAHTALNNYRAENLHGRNYQTLAFPADARNDDLNTVAAFRDALDTFTGKIEDDLRRLYTSTGT